MLEKNELYKRFCEPRKIESTVLGIPHQPANTMNDELDLIKLLRGTWISRAEGWNLIALPTSPLDLVDRSQLSDKGRPFRLLMNQYGETLKFNAPDTGVPNRGLIPDENEEPDQLINAITYEQVIVQKAFEDFPASIRGRHAENGDPIHHEPGFFLQFLNQVTTGTSPDVGEGKESKELKIARMGTIPHGNSVLAMGCVLDDSTIDVADDGALPERLADTNPDTNDYLEPYKYFINRPFFGCLDPAKASAAGFPGFSPDHPHKILKAARDKLNISKTTVLYFDTKFQSINNLPGDKPGSDIPISNVPFVKREANVTEMHATFWILELENTDQCEPPEFVMQYSQTVYLEFFDSDEKDAGGNPRPIRWPHVSINTLRKVDP
jgi:hypothetical protein